MKAYNTGVCPAFQRCLPQKDGKCSIGFERFESLIYAEGSYNHWALESYVAWTAAIHTVEAQVAAGDTTNVCA